MKAPAGAFRNASIKTKLVLLILSVCASMLILSAVLGLARTILEGRQRLLSGVAMTARLLGEYCVVPLSFDDAQEAGSMLERVQSLPGIQRAVLYDSTGKSFAAYPKSASVKPDTLPSGDEDRFHFGRGSLVYYHKVQFRNQYLGTVVLHAATGPLKRAAVRDAAALGVLFLGLILVSYMLALRAQGAISRPILQLADAFRRVSDKGDLSQRVHREGSDEIGILYAGYNHMLGQLQARLAEREKAEAEARLHHEQLVQAGKLVTLGTLVSGVAHEINNPNTYIMLNASLALKQVREMEARLRGDGGEGFDAQSFKRFMGVVENIYQGSKRIDSIVRRLKDYYRKDHGREMDPLEINAVVDKAVEILDAKIRKYTRRFRFDHGGNLPRVAGNFQELEQVAINLIENACQALPNQDGQVTVRTYADEQGQVVLEVEDTGVGILPEHMDRVTDPFFTTKREAGGTGLGLSLVVGILGNHGGSLRLSPGPAGGTRATVRLPALV